ncbi:MAG: glycosyltransferase family 4 protein [Deltaproteobacteria bacterium]|nr:glycosyltransferase family 4 protein [Deltaproteobacteria bacterium]MDZ4347269.1 glycosyltransferase family 4 protein [Candidatus Binatia bacterium]
MKIALAHKRLDLKGGTEKDFYRTAEGLRDLGHEIHLFCSEFGVEPPRDTVAHRIPVLPLGRTARLWNFALLAPGIIEKWRCDVLVSFGRMLKADIVRSGGGSHRGFLERIGEQGGPARRLWQRLSPYHQSVLAIERRQFQRGGYERIVAVSKEVRRDLLRQYAVPRERIVVLYNGVDPRRFHPSLRARFRAQVRARWQIPQELPLVLFVGNGFRRKGLDVLLSVWSAPALSHTYLLVVGDDARLGAYKARARSVAGERIVFAGRQQDVENYYAAADVVALPSLQEAFGNVVLECLAAGLPVLVSREAGAAELLTGALVNGIVDRLDDREELVRKLVKLLDQCDDASLAAEARARGEEFSWERHFHELETLLLEFVRAEHRGKLP